MAQLPQELIVEILSWLPVKSLLRFRSVSKSLCSVIDSLDFINSHLCKSSQNFNLRKLIFSVRSTYQFHVYDVNLDLEEKILHLGKRIVSGSCNGLLLLHISELSLALWNPSTRKYRHLPYCPLDTPANFRVRLWLSLRFGSGLGYDDSTNDYKVILVNYLHQERSATEIQVWIYGFKSNIWRRAPNSPYRRLEGMSYFADGSLHWLSDRDINQLTDLREEIVALDVGKETFSLVSQPINSEVTIDSRLHVFEGCLCVCYFYDSTPCRSVLYMRKKDGVDKFTWTMLFSFTEPLSFDSYSLSYLKILGYSKSRDKILLDIGTAYLVSYDLTQKSFGKVEVGKDPSQRFSNLCIESVCLESLVPVGSEL